MGSVLDHLARTCLHARHAAGREQLDVAQAAGVSEATISRWETRDRRCPEELEAIVDAYAAECSIPAYDLWTAALDAWKAERP